ncbi:hypothetical protein F5X96DRAFT_635799 [Biscogniauxia mediterranea]|nr:hypothetical protein F5X96DRAFT_635799 [Biscogniauxia mediterranea]
MAANLAQGQRLQAEAYATPHVQPADLGLPINGLIYFFSAAATIIIGLRAWVRFGPEQRWGWDDILAIGGYLTFVPSNVLGVMSTYFGLGSLDSSLDPAKLQLLEIRAIEYFMYYEILYFAASSTTKVSITLTVLRICPKPSLCRWVAIGNAVMMITAAGIAGVFVLTNCRPIFVYWNPDLGVCSFGSKGLGSLEVVSLVGSTFQMLSDWVSALLPFFVISNLQMPRRSKIALICILGLGIMASIAAFVRMLFYKYWDKTVHPENYLYHTGVIVLTSELEVGLGIVACSLPPLRRLIKNVYSMFRSTSGPSDLRYENSKGTQLGVLQPQGAHPSQKGRLSDQGKWSRLQDEDSLIKSEGVNKTPANAIICETSVDIESTSIKHGAVAEPHKSMDGW